VSSQLAYVTNTVLELFALYRGLGE